MGYEFKISHKDYGVGVGRKCTKVVKSDKHFYSSAPRHVSEVQVLGI